MCVDGSDDDDDDFLEIARVDHDLSGGDSAEDVDDWHRLSKRQIRRRTAKIRDGKTMGRRYVWLWRESVADTFQQCLPYSHMSRLFNRWRFVFSHASLHGPHSVVFDEQGNQTEVNEAWLGNARQADTSQAAKAAHKQAMASKVAAVDAADKQAERERRRSARMKVKLKEQRREGA